jgi:hypothetical protein
MLGADMFRSVRVSLPAGQQTGEQCHRQPCTLHPSAEASGRHAQKL